MTVIEVQPLRNTAIASPSTLTLTRLASAVKGAFTPALPSPTAPPDRIALKSYRQVTAGVTKCTYFSNNKPD
jgi:hypothetical protein